VQYQSALQQVLDNTALDAIAQQQLGIEQPTVEQGNSLVSTIMAAATAPVRFPGARLPLSAPPISFDPCYRRLLG
jgi:hypothetical protein